MNIEKLAHGVGGIYQRLPNGLERFAALVRAHALEEAAREAEHWQKISRPDHKCGEYIAAAIRALTTAEPQSPPTSPGSTAPAG